MSDDLEKKLLTESKVFCILPWIHFHSLPNKKVLPCCVSDSSLPVSSTKSPSILDMMNSEEFKQLRLNMLNGVESKVCTKCYNSELLGAWTLRQSQNTVRGIANLDAVKATNPDGSIDEFKLKYMDIRWSNICNFKCRSCGPEFSSLHAKEYIEKKHSLEALNKYFNMDDIVVNSNADKTYMQKLKPYLNDVEEVYFAGGESLITPEHYEILEHWIENNKTNILLTYTTNFSVFKFKQKNVLNYWKKFKNVKIYASLDGRGKLAEYLRSGTKWQDIENNVRMIREQVPHVEFNITPTISIWNIHRFPDFIQDWKKKGFITPKTDIRMNVLSYPWWANIQILPDSYKNDCKEKWIKLANDDYFSMDQTNAFKNVLYTLDQGKTNINGIIEFFKDSFATDKMRKENVFTALPELKSLYSWLKENTDVEI
jgi:hypothetical protein